MKTVEDHPVKSEHIATGLNILQKRQNKLSMMSVLTGSVFIVSFVAIFIQQDFIYSFFGLTQTVEQLHIPYSIQGIVSEYHNQPDYLFNLLGWIGWFILKVFCSMIGAFVVIHFLKKFKFFAIRFQSFVLKFVAWLICIILIWSAFTYIQYDMNDDDEQDQYELIHYKQHIQESQIAQILNEDNSNDTVKAYVLGQVALLHKPTDKDVATSYVAQLAQAERTQHNFIEYGFKPEMIWTMQKQVYGQAMTPLAKSIEPKVLKADQISKVVNIALMALSALLFLFSLMFYSISRRLKGRIHRIQHQIEY